MTMKTPALILVTACTLAAATVYAQGQTTNDGVGTDVQVKRGADTYSIQCAACHDAQLAGSGTAPALAGTDFSANWKDETVGSLFERIRATMPADNPGSMKRDQVADLVAFILNFNKYPLGQKDLPTEFEALKAIKITAPK
jgi:S-disulfanyl-L-cysteine oxidoreductase SoxD